MRVIFDLPEETATISITVITSGDTGSIGVGNAIVHRPDLLDGLVSLCSVSPRKKLVRLSEKGQELSPWL